MATAGSTWTRVLWLWVLLMILTLPRPGRAFFPIDINGVTLFWAGGDLP